MTTDERFENLEKGLASARRLNRWLLAAVGLALGVWILAGTFGPTMAAAPGGVGAIAETYAPNWFVKEVRANRFVLEDENGQVRAALSVSKDGPWLSMFDENGKTRAELRVSKVGPGLSLLDEKGKPRAALCVSKDGPWLDLFDENGKTRAELNAIKHGPQLALYDENGKNRAALSVIKDGPTLKLADENGKAIWRAPERAPMFPPLP
jgi:hypothetical protein